MMKRIVLPVTLLGGLAGVAGVAWGQAASMACKDQNGRDMSCELNSQLNASIRIGLTFVDNETTDSDFSISNFGSRLRWGGQTELDTGLNGLAYMEFGINPDENARGNSGVDRTRQLWAGVQGDWGTAKIGAQYAAFYDMVSAYTDIAYWGSCWTEFECSRQTRVLKYEGESAGLQYAASFTGAPDDDGNDFADEIEFGVNYTLGNTIIGAAATVQADDVVIDDAGNTSDDDGGLLVGGVLSHSFDSASLALTLQLADEDFADADDDFTNVTLAGTFGSWYAVGNVGDDGDNSPYYATLGYAHGLTPDGTMYYEVQVNDADDGTDSETIGRAVFIYNFDAATLAAM